jgi:hypothetical protein
MAAGIKEKNGKNEKRGEKGEKKKGMCLEFWLENHSQGAEWRVMRRDTTAVKAVTKKRAQEGETNV